MAHQGWFDPERVKRPRGTEIAEMRKELHRLDQALAHCEHLLVQGATAFGSGDIEPRIERLNLKAVQGWMHSIIESYMVLCFFNEGLNGYQSPIQIMKLFIASQEMHLASSAALARQAQ